MARPPRTGLPPPWLAAGLIGAAALLPTAAEALDARPSAEPGVITVDERRTVLMAVLAPSGAALSTPAAELYAAADRALRAETTLAVASPEQAGLDLAQLTACELAVRLSCWVKLVRASAPAYLFVVSSHPLDPGRDKLSGLWIDVPSALRTIDLHAAPGADRTAGWEQRLEDQLYADAVEVAAGTLAHGEAGGPERWFAAHLERELHAPLDAARAFDGHGTLALRGLGAGLALELDGRALGATIAGTTLVRGLLPGRRHVVLSDPAGRWAPLALDADVAPGETREVAPELVPLASAAPLGPRRLTLYSGLVVAGAGAALTTWALAAAPSARTVAACTGATCADGRSSALASFCELGSGDPSACGGGVLAAPLGYGLALAGGVSAIGAWLAPDEDAWPWLPIVLGLAGGGLAYGVSALAR